MRINLFDKLIVLGLLLISSFATAQITVNTNFDPRTNQPIDVRDTLTFLADTSTVTWTYPGLITYASDVDQFWYYTGSFWKRVVQDPFFSNLQDVDTADIDVDDIAQWDGSNWVMTSPVELIGDGGGAYGSGLAGRTAYWLDDTTLVHTAIAYSSTELNASALTGSFQWPTGTTAQQPVGANGKTRFNSTTGLFEGYHDAAYRPFATFDGTRTANRIPYWDGTKMISEADFTYNGSELTLNMTDQGAYNLQTRGPVLWSNDGTASTGMSFDPNSRTFQVLTGNGGLTFNGNGNNSMITLYGHSTINLRTDVNSDGDGILIEDGSGNDYGFYASRLHYFKVGQVNNTVAFTFKAFNNGNLAGKPLVIEGGQSTSSSGSFNGGKLFLRGGSGSVGLFPTSLPGSVEIGRYGIGGTYTYTALSEWKIDSVFFLKYGFGNITGIPSTWAAWDAKGKFVETTAADIVAAGSGSTNSIYNLLPTQDISIDPNANDLIIGSFGAGNSGDFEFFTTNENGQYVGVFAGTRDSSWLATAGDGFQFDAALFSTGAEKGIMGVNYNYFGTVWNAAVFGDSVLFAPYPGSELNMTINGLPDDPVNPYKVMVQDTVTDRVYLTSIDSLLGSGTAGTFSTSTDGSGDIVVAHGMGVTPTSVQVTVTGTTPYVVTVHTIDATNFTIRFYDMTGAAVTSTAVTATWHCKT